MTSVSLLGDVVGNAVKGTPLFATIFGSSRAQVNKCNSQRCQCRGWMRRIHVSLLSFQHDACVSCKLRTGSSVRPRSTSKR